MDQTTRDLAAMAANLSPQDLSGAAIAAAQRRLLDSIACAAGALEQDFTSKICALSARYRGDASARIWFRGQVSTPEMAGFANGCMVRFLDLSDTALGRAAGHPSDMIPALVALAESRKASGAALLCAIVVAYEIYVGLCEAVAFQKSGIDQATAAALGAAAGAANLMGLSEEQTAHALSLALVANVSLYNVRTGALSDWKCCAGPHAAREGTFAAILAAEDISAPTAIFTGAGGFETLVGPVGFNLDPVGAPRIAATHLKAWPVCYHGQSAIDAALRLAPSCHPDDITSVLIETYDVAWQAMGKHISRWTPANRETADHSLPFVTAVGLTSRRLTPADYLPERLGDPDLLRLMARIEVRPDPEMTAAYPAEARTRVNLLLRDGRSLTAETRHPRGHAENPMTDAEVGEKLANLWPAHILPRVWQKTVAAEVAALPLSLDVTTLVDALCLTAR